MDFLHEFLEELIEILLLLFVIMVVVSFIQSFFSNEQAKKYLNKIKGIKAYILGALLGIVTPFCCCTSVPVFIGFTHAGLPLGVTLSFLLSSALVDLGGILVLLDMFGMPVCLSYAALGCLFSIIGGALADKLKLNDYVEKYADTGEHCHEHHKNQRFSNRLTHSLSIAWSTVKKVFWFVIIGIAIGSLISHFIPADFIENVLGHGNPFAVFIATLLGAPIHAEIFAVIPIAQSLLTKGAGIGTVLSFMVAVTALSIPSIILLKKAMKNKLLLFYLAFLICCLLLTGIIFNLIF